MSKKFFNSLFALLMMVTFLMPMYQVVAQEYEAEPGTKVCDPGVVCEDETEKVGGLVPCGNIRTKITTDTHGKQSGGEILNPCNFDYAILLVNKLVNFLLFNIFVPLAAIVFCYAGFQLLFSGGDTGKMKKAKDIFWNVFIGLVFAVGAWLIIHTISEILGYDGSWIGF